MGGEPRQGGLGDWEVEQALRMRPSCLMEVESQSDLRAFESRLQPLAKETDNGRPP